MTSSEMPAAQSFLRSSFETWAARASGRPARKVRVIARVFIEMFLPVSALRVNTPERAPCYRASGTGSTTTTRMSAAQEEEREADSDRRGGRQRRGEVRMDDVEQDDQPQADHREEEDHERPQGSEHRLLRLQLLQAD